MASLKCKFDLVFFPFITPAWCGAIISPISYHTVCTQDTDTFLGFLIVPSSTYRDFVGVGLFDWHSCILSLFPLLTPISSYVISLRSTPFETLTIIVILHIFL